jgi:hypothetical protein
LVWRSIRFFGSRIDKIADPALRKQVARNALHVIAKMVFEDGFFHADPHPGNIMIGPEDAPVIGLIDLTTALPTSIGESPTRTWASTVRRSRTSTVPSPSTPTTAPCMPLAALASIVRRAARALAPGPGAPGSACR